MYKLVNFFDDPTCLDIISENHLNDLSITVPDKHLQNNRESELGVLKLYCTLFGRFAMVMAAMYVICLTIPADVGALENI